MQVEVLYFAMLRERVGRERESLDLRAGADVAAARAAVVALHPELAPLLPRVQAAVNRVMADDGKALADGDELAFIPPVAGGAGPRKVAILSGALDIDEVLAVVQGPERGGLVTFAGVVRRHGHHLPDVIRLE